MFTSIRNKSVIVTGGTKGLGRGIAGVFTKLGTRDFVVGRNGQAGDAPVEALRRGEGTAILCRGDVKQPLELKRPDTGERCLADHCRQHLKARVGSGIETVHYVTRYLHKERLLLRRGRHAAIGGAVHGGTPR